MCPRLPYSFLISSRVSWILLKLTTSPGLISKARASASQFRMPHSFSSSLPSRYWSPASMGTSMKNCSRVFLSIGMTPRGPSKIRTTGVPTWTCMYPCSL